MVTKRVLINLAFVLGLIGCGFLAFSFWPKREGIKSNESIWTCSMHPQVRLKQPGFCPICGMKLIPVSLINESKKTSLLMGVETEPVRYRGLFKEIHTVGKIDYNEGSVSYIASRVSGRVDHIFADFTGIQIKKGDHLAEIYSPDLFVAQDVLLQAIKNIEQGVDETTFAKAALELTRQKLLLLGILPEQLLQLEKNRTISTHLTIFAPIGGTIIEKNLRSGQYVKEGDMLFKIANLDPIWLYLDIYESDLGWVRLGQTVEVRLEAYPNEIFQGKVSFIDSFLDDKTRTVRARVNLKNPDKKMKPAMYASALIRVNLRPDGSPEPTGLEGKYLCPMHPEIVELKSGRCEICKMPLEKVPLFSGYPSTQQNHGVDPQKPHQVVAPKNQPGVLAIRTSAVLETGKRKITYRQKTDGTYELVELQLGLLAQAHDDQGNLTHYYPVLKGLEEKDRVVVRGGFLLDSQQQINGMPSLLHWQEQPMNLSQPGREMPPPPPFKPGEHKH